MPALILPSRTNKQPQGILDIEPSWLDAIVYARSGKRIYNSGNWLTFADTAAQVVAVGPFGVGVDTTADSTPASIDIVTGTTYQEWALAFVGEARSGTADSAFDIANSTASALRANANAGILDIAPVGLTNHATFSGVDIGHKHGAAVASFSSERGVGRLYVDGAFLAEAAHTYSGALSQLFAVLGGRHLQANRNWRGISYLGVLFNRPLADAEAQALSENPWQIFRTTPRKLYFDVAGGGATIACAVGTIDFTGGDATLDETLDSAPGEVDFAGVQASLVETVAATTGAIDFAGGTATLDEEIGAAAGGVDFAGVQASVEVAGATEINCTAGEVAFTGVQSALLETVFTNTSAVAFQGGTAGFTITLDTVAGAVTFEGVQGTVFAPVIVDCTASQVAFTGVSASIAAGGGPRGRARGRRRHYGTLGPSIDQPEVQYAAQPLLAAPERYIPLSELVREATPVSALPQVDNAAVKKSRNLRVLAEILKHT